MSKILDWIKKHVWQTVLIGFGLFFMPLILVHVAYRIPAISPWFASTWQAGELITYIAGFEAFIGTVFLGVVAVRQNDEANELSELMLKAKEKQDLFERQPIVSISNGTAEFFENFDLNRKTSESRHPFYYSLNLLTGDRKIMFKEVLQIRFDLKFKAKSPMMVKLEEVTFLDTNNNTLSSHDTLACFNHQLLSNYLLPDSENCIECLFPSFVLNNNTFCNCRFVVKLLNNIDEHFSYKLLFTIINTKEQTYQLMHTRTSKI